MKEYLYSNILTVSEYLEHKLNNKSDKQIANDLFVSIQTIKRWKEENGIDNYFVNKYKYDTILNLKKEGYRINEIASELCVHRTTITDICNQFEKEFSTC